MPIFYPSHRLRSLSIALILAVQAGGAEAGRTGGFAVNIPKNREDARNFYNAVYAASEGVAMGWTGQLAGCKPGRVSADYLKAGLTRVNYFRAMAGVPATVTFLADYNAKAQQAALMMLANQSLSHSPPPGWTCYTADGTTAAGSSNLAAGNAGAASIDMYMNDAGTVSLGHRRWVFYPQTKNMGQGSVADASKPTYKQASALWVFDGHGGDARPATRDGFVAWPPKGYVPYGLIYPDWSISYPKADFSQAGVAVSRGGTAIPVTVSHPGNGYGENTLSFRLGTAIVPTAADQVFHVAVTNVLIGGVAQSFVYDVKAFDPQVKTAASVTPVLSGNAQPALNQAETYGFTPVSRADGYRLRVGVLQDFTTVAGAESNSAAGFVVDADTAAYLVVVAAPATGQYAFHLAHPTPPRTQSLTWDHDFYVKDAQAVLRFDSRLGWATGAQAAQVQVSPDGGKSWQTEYEQAGTGGAGESGYVARQVSLQAYAGRTVRLRFAYAFKGGSYYPQTGVGIGWQLDNIRLGNIAELTGQTTTDLGKISSLVYTPTASGQYLLQLQATAFGAYPLEWGPGFLIQVAP